jgi:predicted transcriptional regulator
MKLGAQACIWLYAKSPLREIVGFARFNGLIVQNPQKLWRQSAGSLGIEANEFFSYFAGRNEAFGLLLGTPTRLQSTIPLDRLRECDPAFAPPQFFKRLAPSKPLLSLLRKSVGSQVSLRMP